jgi:hypothetical protein
MLSNLLTLGLFGMLMTAKYRGIQKIRFPILLPIEAEEMREGCTHIVFLVVPCQLSRDPPAAHFSVP